MSEFQSLKYYNFMCSIKIFQKNTVRLTQDIFAKLVYFCFSKIINLVLIWRPTEQCRSDKKIYTGQDLKKNLSTNIELPCSIPYTSNTRRINFTAILPVVCI